MAARRKLRFSEPEKVLECLRLAGAATFWDEIPDRLHATCEEITAAGLATLTPSRRGARFGRARRLLELTSEGRKRRQAANRAAQEAAAAPVEWRWS